MAADPVIHAPRCPHDYDSTQACVCGAHNIMRMADLKAGRNDKKAPLQWVPMWALYGLARVIAYGARIYAPGNWVVAAKDGTKALEDYMSAAQRHWAAIQEADANGVAAWESLDDESALPHLDHLICSLVMLRGIAVKAGLMPKDPGFGNTKRGTP